MSCQVAYAHGCRGMLLAGNCRDTHYILQMPDFPIFCLGTAPNAHGGWEIIAVGEPILLPGHLTGAVTIRPGDFIFGDNDGVQVIPMALVDEVLLRVEATFEKENEERRLLAEGMPIDEVSSQVWRAVRSLTVTISSYFRYLAVAKLIDSAGLGDIFHPVHPPEEKWARRYGCGTPLRSSCWDHRRQSPIEYSVTVLPIPSGASSIGGFDLNDAGMIVGGIGYNAVGSTPSYSKGFIWQSGVLTELPTLPGYASALRGK